MVLYLGYQFLLKKILPAYQNMDPMGEVQCLVPTCPSSTVGDRISNLDL